jgi:ATP-binding cassette subfamily B protein
MLKHLFYILSAAPVDMPAQSGAGANNLVVQQQLLLDDTIYNNIRIARADATEMEILEAADKARVLDFAWDWSDGMYTVVGDGGIELSGVQRQCIMRARSILLQAQFSA